MEKYLTENEKNKLKNLISANNKIEVIKYIRELTGFGLKESKEISDSFFDRPAEIDSFFYKANIEKDSFEETTFEETVHEHKTKSHELSEKELNFVRILLKDGQKLQAVKYVKDTLKSGLKEAKEYVDTFEVESKKTETYVFEQNDNVITEFEIDEKITATFEPSVETKNISPPKKKSAKKGKTTNYESDPIIFGKSIQRDKNKGNRRRQSNSGCMLMLTFMFIGGLLIIGGIYYF